MREPLVAIAGGRYSRGRRVAILQRHALHPGTLAAKLRDARAGSVLDAEPRGVRGAAWGDRVLEQTIALGLEIGVFSWIVAVR